MLHHTLLPSLAATAAIQAAAALPSLLARSALLYDAAGALAFVAVAALNLALFRARRDDRSRGGEAADGILMMDDADADADAGWRATVLCWAVGGWALRLGVYLTARALLKGGDSRLDAAARARFAAAFVLQALWVVVCMMPVMAVCAVPPAAPAATVATKMMDVLGLGMYAGGLLVEVVADAQMMRWIVARERGFLRTGLWSRSRHPNYFGEVLLWTGIATVAAGEVVAQPAWEALGLGPLAALLVCYVSPAFVAFVLFRVSGIPLVERSCDAKYGDRKDYQEWKRNTPRFFPRIF